MLLLLIRLFRFAAVVIVAVALSTLRVSAQSNLVAAYSFNEGTGGTVADASGSGNGGTIGTAGWTAAGKYGGALSFDGTSARVTVPDSASLRLSTAMTLEAWVNPTVASGSWRDVIYKGNDNYYLEATTPTNSAPAIGGIFNSTNKAVYGTAALPLNTWSHLAASYDGATLRLFVNGTQVASAARTGTLAASSNPLQIGGDSIFGQYFRGLIDEVRVYKTALTAAQIQADMNTPIGTSSVVPDLTLTKTHAGSFTQGQTGAAYTLIVRNSGTGATSGTVNVTDTLPANLTATAISGSGWTCTLSTLACTRSDALAAGAAYPSITLIVDVSPTAPSSVTNSAAVSGGGETTTTNDTASDATTIVASSTPDLTLTKTHGGSFMQGQTGAAYTLVVRNTGTGASSGTVNVTDMLPAGLTATAMSGTGWTCTISSLTCTRGDALAAGATYPQITLTVDVSATAPSSVTNSAAVSGGGETNTANDVANDVTAVTTGAPASMITLMQHVGKDAGVTTSSTLAFPANNTAGNWIGVFIRAGQRGQTFNVTDTRGNTYRSALQMNQTVDVATVALYYAENVAGGSNTVTVTDSVTGGTLRFAIFEYAGVAPTSSLDAKAFTEGTGTAVSSPTATTTANGDLVFGMLVTANGTAMTAGPGFVLQERIPSTSIKLGVEDRRQASAGATTATATLGASDGWFAAVAAFRPGAGGTAPPADLTLTKTHAGTFTQGQGGATYTLNVTNAAGSGPTTGTVTVTDTLPAGLTATALTGAGWTCTLGTLTCTRSDALAAGASYPSITLTVTVAATAPATVTNVASVQGGGDSTGGNNTASDPTAIGTAAQDTQAPSAPGPLIASSAGNEVVLSWSAASDNIGVTSYRVEQCVGAGCSTFSEIATVTATNAAPMALPLTASANPNYFKDATGAAIVLNGSQTWNTLQDWGTNGTLQTVDFNAFVDFLVSHGHNFTLLWRTELPTFCGLPTTDAAPPDYAVGPHPWLRTGPGTATDGGLRFDLSRFDQAYFDRVRDRVRRLRDAGIYAGVYLFTGEWLRFRCATDGYPFSGANNINGIDDGGGENSVTMPGPNAITALQDAYVEKLVDTLNDLHNVVWIVSEEAPTYATWWNSHQIAHLRTYETGKPFQHPIGYGVQGDFQDATLANSDADWVAPGVRISPTATCGSGTPRCKVNINDSDHSYWEMWQDTAQQNRNYAWQNFTSGNQVLFMDPYVVSYPREGRNLCTASHGICATPDARWDNFRNNLGYINQYGRRLNLDAVTPQASLCSTGYCLAQTPAAGAEYLVYAPNGGTFTVNLSAMPASRTLTVEWLNPSTGVTTSGAVVSAGATRSFTAPFSGDAVLYLVDSAGHQTTASTQITYTLSNVGPGTYQYRVRAVDAAGNLGAYSNIVSATVQGSSTADLTITKTHSGAFVPGQTGATYTLTVTNVGGSATAGTVTVADALPGGLTATAMNGTGWSCTLSTLKCTRTDSLPAGSGYPPITLTVAVASNAPASVTNSASVSGGGETNSANDSASDVTAIGDFDVSPHTAVITSTQLQPFTLTGLSGGVTWAVDDVVGGSAATGTITDGIYTPPPTAGSHVITAQMDQGPSARATVYVANYAGTFTRDVDNLRTGLNASETVLTQANVNVNQFGKLFSYNIDGVSDASPLYVANVNIPGVGRRNVVYVATEHDSVYAFDADGLQTTPLWKVSFIAPAQGITAVPPADTGEANDISPEIGITGSPVIDPATNTLYVVAKTKEVSGTSTTYVHRLHALDIATGAEKLGGPAVIQASVTGTGDGSSGGRVPFISLRENQRAALMLSGGVVYIAFAGHGDQPPYHGWVLGYRASDLQQVLAFNTTPNGEGGGVWQSGDGLATDATGNIYFVTGDGDFTANTGGKNYGDSFMKISPSGAVVDYFTPHDQDRMDASDIDLGSGGTTLLPDQPGPHPHLAISAGKNGTIYLVDRDNMGRFNSSNDNQIVQTLVNTFPNGSFITGNFKAPVYWNSRLFFSADADNIKSFQVTNGLLSTSPTSRTSIVMNYPGATLSLSSNGAADGILWAIERIDHDPTGGGSTRRPGVLHAFDATNLGIELYNSDQAAGGRDALDYAAKWASPLIANGKVFVATNGRLTAFGLLP